MKLQFAAILLGAVNICSTAISCSASPIEGPKYIPVPPSTNSSSTFNHPGVFVGLERLKFIKAKVNAKQEPWSSAYSDMIKGNLASLYRNPVPYATVECGPISNPNIGCTQERQDALAAYALSLAWYISGNKIYAEKSISIMNAWAKTIKAHTNANAPLQTGWSGASWARAAEIIRYTGAGWSTADISAFSSMLSTVYLPKLIVGSNSNGNWELVMMEAAIGISVFLDDKKSYNTAITKFSSRVPAYIYLTSDGPIPKAAAGSGLTTPAQIQSYWQGQKTFPVSGIAQETCRDFVHTGYGISSIGSVMETILLQGGGDLFAGDFGNRLRSALNFHLQYQNGAAVPSWLCNGHLHLGIGPVTEVGYNALSKRLGASMPNTQSYTLANRPLGTDLLFVGWETLTHAL